MAGARTATYPSFDVASGAPTGQGATNEILLAWTDARAEVNQDQAFLEASTDGWLTFSAPVAISQPGHRSRAPRRPARCRRISAVVSEVAAGRGRRPQ